MGGAADRDVMWAKQSAYQIGIWHKRPENAYGCFKPLARTPPNKKNTMDFQKEKPLRDLVEKHKPLNFFGIFRV